MNALIKLKENNKLKTIIIMIFLSLLFCLPYISKEPISVHDVSYHINRINSISEELKNGNFPVLMHSNLLGGLGYANSLFYPELFLYLPAVLVSLGVNIFVSYKILIIICTFFTMLFSYMMGEKIFNKKGAGWITSIIYVTSYYRLTDIFVRGAIGEVLAITFFPIIIYGLYNIIFEDSKKWYYIPIGVMGIINSHVLSFALTGIFIVVCLILNIDKLFKKPRKILFVAIAGIFSILLAISFIGPYIEQEINDTFIVDNHDASYNFMITYGTSIKEIFAVYFSNGMIQGHEHYKTIGLFLIIASSLVFITKKSDSKRFMIELWGIGIILCVLSLSIVPWGKIIQKMYFLSIIQFPYRLHILSSALLAIVAAYTAINLLENFISKNRNLYIVLGTYIGSAMVFVLFFNPNSLNYTYEKIMAQAPIGNAEYLPVDCDREDKSLYNINNPSIKIDFNKTKNGLEFEYNNMEDEMQINIPLTYYKGYKANITLENGEKKNLQLEENQINKHVLIRNNEKISGHIEVKYEMTLIQKISYMITIVSLITLIIIITINKRKK